MERASAWDGVHERERRGRGRQGKYIESKVIQCVWVSVWEYTRTYIIHTRHMYTRVHLPRILSKSLVEKIDIMEMEDRADPAPLQIYRNKRRPWKHFRNLVLEDLPKSSGLHEVNAWHTKTMTLQTDGHNAIMWDEE